METCIICLGDMPVDQTRDSSSTSASPDHVDLTIDDLADVILARLPCSHILHNSCLSAWIARANSCPICRQNFNNVDLISSYNGPVVSTYTVEDKVQAAQYDEAEIPPDDEEDIIEYSNCLVCERDENDNVLLICDGCDCTYHTYCIGLESVPRGEWHCPICVDNRVQVPTPAPVVTSATSRRAPRRPRTRRARNEAQTRRRRERGTQWNRAWQATLANLNADLSSSAFNENDEETPRRMRQSREAHQWSRRMEVARRQGGHERLQEAAPALFSPPKPLTEEEINSWAMMDAAERMQGGVSSARGAGQTNKATASNDTTSRAKRQRSTSVEIPPTPERERKKPRSNNTNAVAGRSTDNADPPTERKLKRPMTRRNITLRIDAQPESGGPTPKPETASPKSRRVSQNPTHLQDQASPSLLDSLLEDINKPKPFTTFDRTHMPYFNSSALSPGETTLSSIITPAPSPPRMASPVLPDRNRRRQSPESGSDAEDRISMHKSRKSSPLRNSAAQEPSTTDQADSSSDHSDDENSLQQPVPRHTHFHVPLSPDISPELKPHNRFSSPLPPPPPPPPPPPAAATSPTTTTTPSALRHPPPKDSTSATSPTIHHSAIKTEIEKLVRLALKPHYVPGGISRDDFTNINRTVTKKMYETLKDAVRIREWEKKKWQRVAEEEVQKELEAIKP